MPNGILSLNSHSLLQIIAILLSTPTEKFIEIIFNKPRGLALFIEK